MIGRSILVGPFLLLAALSMLTTMPTPSRAAEPGAMEFDIIAELLRTAEPDAVFTGRTKDGTGYVVLSMNRAYFLKPQKDGRVRIVKVDGKAVRTLVAESGWRL